MLKKVLKGVAALVVVLVAAVGSYAAVQASRFDASMDKVYDVPLPKIAHSTDPQVIARGKHLAESIVGCATRDCHGPDLAGGRPLEMGPLGELTGPNITSANLGAAYSDGELARLIRYGVKKDGRSLRFMPVEHLTWLPDADLAALVSYVRAVPPVEKSNGPVRIGLLGKILDRRGELPLDVARLAQAAGHELAPPPEPTARYGRFLAEVCTGCHGDHLSGGRIPGTPSSFPTPSNLTSDPTTGLAKWTYDDFDKLLTTATKPDGSKLDPFMPVTAFGKMNDLEKHALFAYLKSLPARPFGGR